MTKGELIDMVLTNDEKRNIDPALPQKFVDDFKELVGTDPSGFYVWSYMTENLTGEPLNLAELLIQRQGDRLQRIDFVVKSLR